MPKKELLDTAKAALRRALEVTEKLLDGIPIPGAKGTIAALLQVIDEAQVCTEILHRFYHLIVIAENGHQRKTLQRIERAHHDIARPTTPAPSWQNGGGNT